MKAVRARWDLAAALLVGALLGGALVWWARRPHAPELPREPALYVPASVRGIVVADVARLRRAPSLRRLFDAPRATDPCEVRLLRRVERVAIALAGIDAAEFGAAFTGALPREQLVACARETRGAGAVTRADSYRGVELVRVVAPSRGEAPIAGGGSEIAYLPGGAVLAGPPEMLRRMVDRGFAGPPTAAESATPLQELRARLPRHHAAEFAYHFGAAPPRTGDDAFRRVVGVAAAASFERGAEVEAVVACSDFDAPREVADALVRIQSRLVEEITEPAIARALRAVVIERRASDVRVRATLDARETDALLAALEELVRGRDPAEPPRPP